MTAMRDPLDASLGLLQVPVFAVQSGLPKGLAPAAGDISGMAGCGAPQERGEALSAAAMAPAMQALPDSAVRFAGRIRTGGPAFLPRSSDRRRALAARTLETAHGKA